MWAAALAIIGELLKFFCKLGLDWLDQNKEKRKKREEIKNNEIATAKTQHELIMAINKYNRV